MEVRLFGDLFMCCSQLGNPAKLGVEDSPSQSGSNGPTRFGYLDARGKSGGLLSLRSNG